MEDAAGTATATAAPPEEPVKAPDVKTVTAPPETTQTPAPATPPPVQLEPTNAIPGASIPSPRVYHGPLGDDVVYMPVEEDEQTGITCGQPVAGKIVKIIEDNEEERRLVCNLHLYAADCGVVYFKANVALGDGPGKFQFN